MIIQITGDREWDNLPVVIDALSHFTPGVDSFVHGYCRGADLTVEVVATEMGFETHCCPAHWRHNDKNWVKFYGPCDSDCQQIVGNAAGIVRNAFMLDRYSPEVVLAFHDRLWASTGTYDMIRRARAKGLDVLLYNYEGFLMKNPPLTIPALIDYIDILTATKEKSLAEVFFDFED